MPFTTLGVQRMLAAALDNVNELGSALATAELKLQQANDELASLKVARMNPEQVNEVAAIVRDLIGEARKLRAKKIHKQAEAIDEYAALAYEMWVGLLMANLVVVGDVRQRFADRLAALHAEWRPGRCPAGWKAHVDRDHGGALQHDDGSWCGHAQFVKKLGDRI